MLIFASLEGPPLSFFELGVENADVLVSPRGDFGDEMTSLASTMRRVVLIVTSVVLTVQVLRMTTVVMKGRKTV